MEELRYAPSALWPLGDSSPFQDYSGKSLAASVAGTEKNSISLSSNASFSQVFDSTRVAQFDSPIYRQGYEDKPFSITASILPIEKTKDISQEITNNIRNSSFETNTSLWTFAKCSMAVSTAWAKSGTSSALYTITDNTSLPYTYPQGSAGVHHPAAPGDIIRFQTNVKSSPSGDRGWRATIIWYDSAKAALSGAALGPWINVPAGSEATLYLEGTVPSNGAYFIPLIYLGTTTGGLPTSLWEHGWIDSSIATINAPISYYFDGDTNGAVWTGTAHASQSTLLVSSSPQQLLSHQGVYDGLSIDGTIVNFSTAYATTGEARCSYDLGVLRSADIAAVHTSKKNFLFVDGQLVSEVEISEEQQADSYAHSSNNLYSGDSDSSRAVAMNNLALFNKALATEDIRRIQSFNNRVVEASVPGTQNGEVVYVSTAARPAFIELVWDDDEDWSFGVFTGVSSEEGYLVPDMENGLTVAGTWEFAVDLYDGETPVQINSMNVMYDGENVSIQASLDGETWETVERGSSLSIIPPGFDPTDKLLLIRALFSDGVEDAYLDTLQVNGYLTDVVDPVSGRTIQFVSPAFNYNEHSHIALREDWGVELNGGHVVIGGDPREVRTVELWIKINDGTTEARFVDFNPTISQSYGRSTTGDLVISSGAVQYVNGLSSTTLPRIGEWAIVHVVFTAGTTGEITLNAADSGGMSGNVTIGRVALYESALTAAEVKNLYDSYVGVPELPVSSESVVNVSEPATSAVIYAHDWEIVST